MVIFAEGAVLSISLVFSFTIVFVAPHEQVPVWVPSDQYVASLLYTYVPSKL